MFVISKNLEKEFSSHETRTRSPRGPSSPRGSGSMTERTDVPLSFERRRQWNSWTTRCKTLARIHEFTLATTLTQATQKSAARPNRASRDQAERRKTTPEHGPC